MRISATTIALAAGLTIVSAAARGEDDALKAMTGCWESEDFAYTSLLKSASDGKSNQMVAEKMWLRFDVIPDTDYLVLGYIYEWDKEGTYVLGPTYQNGAYDPALKHLTFGFPEGGLDTVTQPDPDHLLYVHAKAAELSAMSVRMLKRIACEEAGKLEVQLLAKQKELKN